MVNRKALRKIINDLSIPRKEVENQSGDDLAALTLAFKNWDDAAWTFSGGVLLEASAELLNNVEALEKELKLKND